MKISKHKNASELIKEFNAIFPLLKIKFYRKAHEPYAGSTASDEIVEEVTLGELNPDVY